MNELLGERMKRLRQQNGLNQVQFAAAMGVTKQCVSNWENDNVVPSIEMLVKIADYFKVSTDSLLGRAEGAWLSVEGLSEEEIGHVRLIIKDLRGE